MSYLERVQQSSGISRRDFVAASAAALAAMGLAGCAQNDVKPKRMKMLPVMVGILSRANGRPQLAGIIVEVVALTRFWSKMAWWFARKPMIRMRTARIILSSVHASAVVLNAIRCFLQTV